ncbi:hypothetical protein [Shewanella algidipiscicola]|uniref:Uncharacterized protein n=1 Tax=Shewanella algidipiscicola TaxID=614070 RepID=A0ABQ4PB03_9GAMM|nr:hypothetical protein [Shewanella algidipiscicola]GIU44623.1 hypothetical protein TUM4630_10710 [Shewanella algidipiscicola]
MFNKIRRLKSESRSKELALYEIVADELEKGSLSKPLWVKAIANSKGNDSKTKSLYIKYRVLSLMDEEQLQAIRRDQEDSGLLELTRLIEKARKKNSNFDDLALLSKKLGIITKGTKGFFKDKWVATDKDGRQISFSDSDRFESYLLNIFDSW